MTQRDVANNLLISLSGSAQTTPTFWLNPATGVSYPVATMTPEYRMNSLGDLAGIPLPGDRPQILGALATFERGSGVPSCRTTMSSPSSTSTDRCRAAISGAWPREITGIVDQMRPTLPRGTRLAVRGQIETMQSSFAGLLSGWRSRFSSSTC
jgi:hypothetical protein